jgi:hypothetical protein
LSYDRLSDRSLHFIIVPVVQLAEQGKAWSKKAQAMREINAFME